MFLNYITTVCSIILYYINVISYHILLYHIMLYSIRQNPPSKVEMFGR